MGQQEAAVHILPPLSPLPTRPLTGSLESLTARSHLTTPHLATALARSLRRWGRWDPPLGGGKALRLRPTTTSVTPPGTASRAASTSTTCSPTTPSSTRRQRNEEKTFLYFSSALVMFVVYFVLFLFYLFLTSLNSACFEKNYLVISIWFSFPNKRTYKLIYLFSNPQF